MFVHNINNADQDCRIYNTESAAHGFIVSILSVVDPHTLEVVSAQVDAARRLFDRLLEQHGLEPSTAPECDDSSRR